MNYARIAFLFLVILAAAATRLLPHPLNFTPIAAIALCGGACFANRWLAFLLPMAAMLLSDIALGWRQGDWSVAFHETVPAVYGAFAIIVCLGFLLRHRRQVLPIAVTTLASSVIFFLISNLGTWALTNWYPHTWAGLVHCFTLAVPFFKNTLLGDACYATAIFGTVALAEWRWSILREHSTQLAISR